MQLNDANSNVIELILRHVFQFDDSQWCQRTNNCLTKGYFVIPGSDGPRWIIPACSRQGKPVLKHWNPYNLKSRYIWNVLLWVYSIGMLPKIPGVRLLNVNNAIDFKIPGKDEICIPVVYIGTPGNQRKAVVTLVSPFTNEPKAVLKVALADGAKVSLMHEAICLSKLTDLPAINAPRLIAFSENYQKTWQSVVAGKLTSRKFTQAHVDWLVLLPKSDNSTTLEELQDEYYRILEHNYPALSDTDKSVFNCALERLQGLEIFRVLSHGDFTPWNLKRLPDGKISAIDWEEANFNGFPLWDICHFFFLQSYLFNVKEPFSKMKTNFLVRQYLKKLQMPPRSFDPLVLLYVLSKLLCSNDSRDEAYKAFLFSQIPSVIGQ